MTAVFSLSPSISVCHTHTNTNTCIDRHTISTFSLFLDPVLCQIRQAGTLSIQPPAKSALLINTSRCKQGKPAALPVAHLSESPAQTNAESRRRHVNPPMLMLQVAEIHNDKQTSLLARWRAVIFSLSTAPRSAGTVWAWKKVRLEIKVPTVPCAVLELTGWGVRGEGWCGVGWGRMGMWSTIGGERVWLQSPIQLLSHSVNEKHTEGERERERGCEEPSSPALHAAPPSLSNQIHSASGAGWRRGIWLAEGEIGEVWE